MSVALRIKSEGGANFLIADNLRGRSFLLGFILVTTDKTSLQSQSFSVRFGKRHCNWPNKINKEKEAAPGKTLQTGPRYNALQKLQERVNLPLTEQLIPNQEQSKQTFIYLVFSLPCTIQKRSSIFFSR